MRSRPVRSERTGERGGVSPPVVTMTAENRGADAAPLAGKSVHVYSSHNVAARPINVTVSGTQRADNGIFNGLFTLRNPISAKYGPDGSLYILNYSGFYSTTNPGLMKVDYIGSCTLTPVVKEHGPSKLFSITVGLNGLTVNEPGKHEIGLFDLSGHKIFSQQGGMGAEYSFAGLRKNSRLEKGVYVLRVKTERGIFVRDLSLF